jgi:hypothetical protein
MHTSIYSGLNFYVYLITDLNPIGTEKYYIGSATRKILKEDNIDPELDTYYGSSTVEHFRILQDSRSSQLERVVIKTFMDSRVCRMYEEMIQKDHNVIENPLFYNKAYANGVTTSSKESTIKRLNTMIGDIDENGLDGIQRASLKRVDTMNNDVDEKGFNAHQRSTVKHYD